MKKRFITNVILTTVLATSMAFAISHTPREESKTINLHSNAMKNEEGSEGILTEEFLSRPDVAKNDLEAFMGTSPWGGSSGKFGGLLPNADHGGKSSSFNLDDILKNTWKLDNLLDEVDYNVEYDLITDFNTNEIIGIGFSNIGAGPSFSLTGNASRGSFASHGTNPVDNDLSFWATNIALKIKIVETGETFWFGTPESQTFTEDPSTNTNAEYTWEFPSGPIPVEKVPVGLTFEIIDVAFSGWVDSAGAPLFPDWEQNLWAVRNPLSQESFDHLVLPNYETSFVLSDNNIETKTFENLNEEGHNHTVIGFNPVGYFANYDYDSGETLTEFTPNNISTNISLVNKSSDYILPLTSDKESSMKISYGGKDPERPWDEIMNVEFDFYFDNPENYWTDSLGSGTKVSFSDLLGIENYNASILIDEEMGQTSDIEIVTGTATEDSFQVKVNNTQETKEHTLSENDEIILSKWVEVPEVVGDDGHVLEEGHFVKETYAFNQANENLEVIESSPANEEGNGYTIFEVSGLEEGQTYMLERVQFDNGNHIVWYDAGDEGNRLSETTLPHLPAFKILARTSLVFIMFLLVLPLLIYFIWTMIRKKYNINFHSDPHGYKTNFIEILVFNTKKHRKTKNVFVEDLEMWSLDRKLEVSFLTDTKHKKGVIKGRIYLDQFEDHETTSKFIAGLLHDHITIRKDGKVLEKIHYIEGRKLKKFLKQSVDKKVKFELEDADEIKDVISVKEERNETRDVVFNNNLGASELEKVKRLPLLKAALELGIEGTENMSLEELNKEVYLEMQVKKRLEEKHRDEEYEFNLNNKEEKNLRKELNKEVKSGNMEIEEYEMVVPENESEAAKKKRLMKLPKDQLAKLADSILDFAEDNPAIKHTKDTLAEFLLDEDV